MRLPVDIYISKLSFILPNGDFLPAPRQINSLATMAKLHIHPVGLVLILFG